MQLPTLPEQSEPFIGMVFLPFQNLRTTKKADILLSRLNICPLLLPPVNPNAEAVVDYLDATGLAETPVTSQAPAPSPSSLPGTCALEYLVNAGNFNSLIELIEAASQSADIARESPSSSLLVYKAWEICNSTVHLRSAMPY